MRARCAYKTIPLHPQRRRIILALQGRHLTVQQLGDRLRDEPKTWGKAVLHGLGHGCTAALLISGLIVLQLVGLIARSAADLSARPPERRGQAEAQLAALQAQPA